MKRDHRILSALILVPLILTSAGKKPTDLDRAKVLIKKGKYALSIDYLKKAAEKQGETGDIKFLFGTSYFQMKKYYWAEQWLEKCLSDDSENESALLMLFRIQDRLQKYHDLEPGDEIEQHTYYGHSWVAKAGGRVVSRYTAQADALEWVVY